MYITVILALNINGPGTKWRVWGVKLFFAFLGGRNFLIPKSTQSFPSHCNGRCFSNCRVSTASLQQTRDYLTQKRRRNSLGPKVMGAWNEMIRAQTLSWGVGYSARSWNSRQRRKIISLIRRKLELEPSAAVDEVNLSEPVYFLLHTELTLSNLV